MNLNETDHVYKVIPDVFGMREKYDAYREKLAAYESDSSLLKPLEPDVIIFHLKGISQDDFDEAVRTEAGFFVNHAKDRAAELAAENQNSNIRKRVIKIEGLTVGPDKKPIETWDDLRKYPESRDFAQYVAAVIYSTESLREAEIKN